MSRDGDNWGLPGGRPEGTETWYETLCREVMDEACANVQEARLLGFNRSRCVAGTLESLVLVRAFWQATVKLAPWYSVFEMPFRRVFPKSEVRQILLKFHPNGDTPVLLRAFDETRDH